MVANFSSAETPEEPKMKLAEDINSLPEGYIGKVQILASGKARFMLGDNSFEIKPGIPVGFREVGKIV